MAITISGENNNDRILAQDGVIDSISGFNIAGIITASSFTGDLTGDVTGNLTGNVTGNINNSTLLLQVGGTEKLRLNSDRVIIGQTLSNNQPTYNTSTTFVTTHTNNPGAWNAIAIIGGHTTGASFLKFGDRDNEAVSQIGHYNVDNSLRFYTNGYNERLRMKSDGNVGIGTEDPQMKFVVSTGGSGIEFNPKVGGTNDHRILAYDRVANVRRGLELDAQSLEYRRDLQTRLKISSNGYTGIGTDNPTELFDVHSNNSAILRLYTKASTSNASLNLRGGGNSKILFGDTADHDIGEIRYNHTNNNNYMSFHTNTDERLRIDSNGRVLIGHDSTPQAALSVAVVGSYGASSTLTPFVYLCRDEDATSIGSNESLGQILFASRDGYRGAVIESKAAGTWSGSSSDGYLVFKTTPDNATVPEEKLRITSDGKIGIDIQNPVARLHVHNSGTGAGDHAYAHFTTGDTGSTISDGLTVGIAANQVASVNYREAGTLSLNTSSTPRITILSDGKVGVNGTPDHQFTVLMDGLSDNSYGFKTTYRSGNNASGYTASGITIVSSANDSNGDQNTAYLQFSNRSPALNGSHGASAFITMTTPDAQGSYGTGEFNFYCRNGSEYAFPNDPAVPSSYWMGSLFKIKSTGELFGYGSLRLDTGTSADGIVGRVYGTAYFGLKQADQLSSEYMIISNNNHTYISCSTGHSIYLRPSANSSAHETIFAHDVTTFKSHILMDSHSLRRSQFHTGHLEGGHTNIGSSSNKTNPIFTIGSNYNPNENDLNNMYGIGYCYSTASFIHDKVTAGWGQYVASDGDARIFLNGQTGDIYPIGVYGRVSHNTGHLEGSYTNVGNNSTMSNPIYSIGSAYNPSDTSLSNFYGIGYTHAGNASFIGLGNNVAAWGLYVAADGDARAFIDGSNGKMAITGTFHGNASDVRLKKNIKVIDNPIEKIKKIRGVTFDWVDNITSEYDFHPDNMHETGVIAQEIQEVIPDAAETAPFNGNYTQKSGTDHNFLTVQHEKIIPLCIEAIKKLTAKVEALESELNTLKGS